MSERKVSIYRRVPKDRRHPLGFEILNPDNPLFSKPTLLCCGGIFINHSRHDQYQESANGFAKVGHAMLGYKDYVEPNDPIDIVSVAYPESELSLSHFLHRDAKRVLAGEPQEENPYAARFAAQHFFPLIQDESGHARPLEQVKRNLRNVTVLAHSYGAAFIQHVGNHLVEQMERLGFAADAIREATAQVVVVNAGPTAIMGAGRASFTTFNMFNMRDTQMGNLYDVREMVTTLLARTESEKPLLVNTQNQPVRRDRPRTPDERYRGPQEHIAQPLSIVPLRFQPGAAHGFYPDANSREYMVCAAQPYIINGLGQVIEKEGMNPHGVITNLRGGVPATRHFLPKDETFHQPQSYFHYNLNDKGEFSAHGYDLRTAMSCVLSHSISNALANREAGQAFTELPAPAAMLSMPRQIRYEVAPDVDFTRVPGTEQYNALIAASLSGPQAARHR